MCQQPCLGCGGRAGPQGLQAGTLVHTPARAPPAWPLPDRSADVFAAGGDGTLNLLWRLEHGEGPAGLNPQVVFLMIGANDVLGLGPLFPVRRRGRRRVGTCPAPSLQWSWWASAARIQIGTWPGSLGTLALLTWA